MTTERAEQIAAAYAAGDERESAYFEGRADGMTVENDIHAIVMDVIREERDRLWAALEAIATLADHRDPKLDRETGILICPHCLAEAALEHEAQLMGSTRVVSA